jgi:CPA2 family monovalent cation:H+ antiporter-2
LDHEIPYLREIFVFLAAAGLVIPTVRKLGVSSVLGFLFAGLLIGPHGLNRIVVDVPLLAYVVIADVDGVRRVAELGIIFLLFMIGLELSTRQLWGMRRIVFGLGTGEVCASAAIIGAIAYAFGNSMIASAILGLCLALSSTALVMQSLTETGRLGTRSGRATFGILLFQDLAVVPILFLVGVAGAKGSESLAGAATRAILQAAIIIAAILAVGRIAIRPLLRFVGGSGSREVFMAAVLLIVLGTAALTAQAGLSMALGAFLAGLLFADTEYRHQIASDIEPFKGLLLGLFFMSVGMSLDVSAVWQLLGWVVLSVIGLVALKAGTLFVVSKAIRQPAAVAAETAVLFCQGGEFAFVVLAAGLAVGVLDPTVGQFMLMVVILTMFLPPALSAADRLLGRFFGEAGEWHPRTCRPRDRGSPHDYRRLRPDWASSG